MPATARRWAAAPPGSAGDRAPAAPRAESSDRPSKSTPVAPSSARGPAAGPPAHTARQRAAPHRPATRRAPSRAPPESAPGSTQCACPGPGPPSTVPAPGRCGFLFLASVVLCAPWVMTSWNVPFFAERSFLYGVATRISTETSTHSALRAMLFRSTYARHRIRHGIRHTAARAGRRPCPSVAYGPFTTHVPTRPTPTGPTLVLTGPEDFLDNRELEVGQTVQLRADLRDVRRLGACAYRGP